MLVGDVCFCFFKQKTAYEMRISDWSSDVCSSDLGDDHRAQPSLGLPRAERGRPRGDRPAEAGTGTDGHPVARSLRGRRRRGVVGGAGVGMRGLAPSFFAAPGNGRRSEEHTSELQSLMRISYAVFCLKKKKHEQ